MNVIIPLTTQLAAEAHAKLAQIERIRDKKKNDMLAYFTTKPLEVNKPKKLSLRQKWNKLFSYSLGDGETKLPFSQEQAEKLIEEYKVWGLWSTNEIFHSGNPISRQDAQGCYWAAHYGDACEEICKRIVKYEGEENRASELVFTAEEYDNYIEI